MTIDTAYSPETRALVRLSMVSGVGPRIRQALFQRFGDAEQTLLASPSDLQEVPGVGPKLARRIAMAHEEIDVDSELALCREHDVHVVIESMERYPRPLVRLPDPPSVLYTRGELQPGDALAIAIVGTRHATAYGKQQAERLARGLALAGLTVVSGLARGIDAAAHRGALEAGGRTLAVLGSGVLNIYPPEHDALATEIAGQGAVLSESPPRFQPLAGSFPQRNRLISGLSLGVIVVEAAQRSGALITARHAMEQDREVFAVPGRVDSRASHGCHALLRDGARLVETVDDVLEELGPLVEPAPRDDGTTVRRPAELQLNAVEQQVLQAIDAQPTPVDRVISATGLPAGRVLATLSVLEMRRLVRRGGGNSVARV